MYERLDEGIYTMKSTYEFANLFIGSTSLEPQSISLVFNYENFKNTSQVTTLTN